MCIDFFRREHHHSRHASRSNYFFFFSMQLKHTYNTHSILNKTLLNSTDMVIEPEKGTVIYIKLQVYPVNEVTDKIQHSLDLGDNDDLIICPALTKSERKLYTVLISNFSEHRCTLKKVRHIATFSILTPEPAKYIETINLAPLRYLLDTNHDYAFPYANSVLKMPKFEEPNETYWSATPQEPDDETQHTPMQKRISKKW